MQNYQFKSLFSAGILTCLLMTSCERAEEGVNKGVAVIHPTENSKVHGVVTFTSEQGGVRIVADLEGLSPGEHGFHIHEFGDCSALDGTSAGGHFNPTNKNHGCPEDSEHHVGDLGNLVADESGKAHYEAMNQDVKFAGKSNIIGRAIIIHEGKDDCTTQPTGASGARVGCGIIGIGK